MKSFPDLFRFSSYFNCRSTCQETPRLNFILFEFLINKIRDLRHRRTLQIFQFIVPENKSS